MEFTGTGKPLTAAAFNKVQSQLKVEPASLWAILSVETRGMGFFPDRSPKILFERHIFHGLTSGKFAAAAPDLSNPKPGGYVGGPAEYSRLLKAITMNRQAALESVSWGLGQIMGFNAVGLKYATVEKMIAQFRAGENAQLEGCCRFIKGNAVLNAALVQKQWDKVALLYNGPNYAANQYDQKLQKYYVDFSAKGLPDINLRAAQVRLTYLGFDPNGVDGIAGPGTRRALLAFQHSAQLPESGTLDKATAAALRSEAGV